MHPVFRTTDIDPLNGDTDLSSFALNTFAQATVASKNSITGADHAEVFSGGQGKAIPGDPIFPKAMNDSASVVGTARTPSFDFHPWLCQFNGSGCAGGVKNLAPPLGGTNAFAAGINNADVLVGKSDTAGDAAERAFSCPVSTGACTDPKDLGTLGGTDSTATAIAGNGQVVGSGDTSGDAATHAMVCPPSAASCTDLGTLNDGADSEADAVDGSGDIAGWSNVHSGSGTEHAFLYTAGNGMQDLGTIPGQAAGTYSGANGVANYLGMPIAVGASGADGFIWSGGKMFSLDKALPPGSGIDTTYPEAINRYRQIITDTASGGTAIISPEGLTGQLAFTSSGIQKHGPAAGAIKTAASPVSVQQGGAVQWVNADSVSHNVVDSSGMGLFHSPTLAPGRGYAFTFNAAGTYGYRDTLHSQTGRVQVPLATAPSSGHPSTLFQIYFAANAPPSGYVYDLQVKKPGASAFSSLLTGTKKTLASFTPTAGTGTYSFRARIRNTANGHTSGWSPVRTISITP